MFSHHSHNTQKLQIMKKNMHTHYRQLSRILRHLAKSLLLKNKLNRLSVLKLHLKYFVIPLYNT